MIGHVARRLLVSSSMLLLLAPAAVAAQAPVDSASLPAALHEARAEFVRGILARDGSAAGALLADSAVAEVDVDRIVGQAAIIDGFLIPQLEGITTIRFGPARFSRTDEDIVETATYFVTPADVNEEQSGTSTTHWRQVGDAWRIIRLIVVPGG